MTGNVTAEPGASTDALRADDRTDAADGLSNTADGLSKTLDRAPALPASVSVGCVQGFAPAALAGAVIALVAPVTFVRVLGLVAVGAAVLGVLLHVYLLRRDHPAAWKSWFVAQQARLDRLWARWRHEPERTPRGRMPERAARKHTGERASAPRQRAPRARGFARFAPIMAQEN